MKKTVLVIQRDQRDDRDKGKEERNLKVISILKGLRTLDIGDEGVRGHIEEFMRKSGSLGI